MQAPHIYLLLALIFTPAFTCPDLFFQNITAILRGLQSVEFKTLPTVITHIILKFNVGVT